MNVELRVDRVKTSPKLMKSDAGGEGWWCWWKEGRTLHTHRLVLICNSSGQGDAHVGCVRTAGGSGQEHADVTESRGRAAEPRHQGAPLAATHEVDQGLPLTYILSPILSAVQFINRIPSSLCCSNATIILSNSK